jgi:type II secretory pathway pseudopilin PulG
MILAMLFAVAVPVLAIQAIEADRHNETHSLLNQKNAIMEVRYKERIK